MMVSGGRENTYEHKMDGQPPPRWLSAEGASLAPGDPLPSGVGGPQPAIGMALDALSPEVCSLSRTSCPLALSP